MVWRWWLVRHFLLGPIAWGSGGSDERVVSQRVVSHLFDKRGVVDYTTSVEFYEINCFWEV